LGCLWLLLAAIAVLRFSRSMKLRSNSPEPVTILKPLRGAEPGLRQRLWSFVNQEYAAPMQIICGLRDAGDLAIGSAETLARPGCEVALVADPRQRGSNPKVSNLANMLHRAQHDVLVLADSDIEVGRDFLNQIVAELQRPGVGAVSCLYHGLADDGFWPRQSALAINAHFLPNVVLAIQLGLSEPCFGAAIAMRRGMLCRIGGFEAFADSLADDYEIGAAVRAAGAEVVIPRFSIGHACFEGSLRALLAHDLRAARTIKSIDPIGYCGALLTHPFPLAPGGGEQQSAVAGRAGAQLPRRPVPDGRARVRLAATAVFAHSAAGRAVVRCLRLGAVRYRGKLAGDDISCHLGRPAHARPQARGTVIRTRALQAPARERFRCAGLLQCDRDGLPTALHRAGFSAGAAL
jgi:ceramide glucosyltransferase